MDYLPWYGCYSTLTFCISHGDCCIHGCRLPTSNAQRTHGSAAACPDICNLVPRSRSESVSIMYSPQGLHEPLFLQFRAKYPSQSPNTYFNHHLATTPANTMIVRPSEWLHNRSIGPYTIVYPLRKPSINLHISMIAEKHRSPRLTPYVFPSPSLLSLCVLCRGASAGSHTD